MIKLEAGWLAILATLPMTASVQQDDAPDVDFLEYLGIWQAEDEEWFLESEMLEQQHKKSESQKRDEDEDR
jgi:hypothetical protein